MTTKLMKTMKREYLCPLTISIGIEHQRMICSSITPDGLTMEDYNKTPEHDGGGEGNDI
jgi:hypothetical protein